MGLVMRFIFLAISLFLSSCGVNSNNGTSTDVTISLGQSIAAGAIGAQGSIPASVQSVSVTAISKKGEVIAGPIIANRPNFTIQIRVPNGNDIRFRILAFDTKGAKGIVLYETLSAPVDLKGKPIAVPVKMSLSVKVAADKTTTFRGGTVNLIGKVSGNTPNASSPLLWARTGGILANTDPYGATNTWIAPATLGNYTIAARIDPAANPDQDPNVKGTVKINIVNRDPYVESFINIPLSVVAGGVPLLLSNFAVFGDLDGDNLQVSSIDKPSWVDIRSSGSNPLSLNLAFNPNASVNVGVYTFKIGVTDGFNGFISRNISVTVTETATFTPTAPTITSPVNGATVGSSFFISGQVTSPPTVGIDLGIPTSSINIDIYIDANYVGSDLALADGPTSFFSFAAPNTLTDGAHTISAFATVGGVRSAASNSVTVTLDTIAPAVTLNPIPASVTTDPYTIGGTVETGATVSVLVDGFNQTANVTGTSWSLNIVGAGAHTVTVSASDVAGNITTLPQANFTISTPIIATGPTTISTANGNAAITGANCSTVWDSYGSPYIIQNSVFIASGCRLLIDPYTVMKFNSSTGIFVQLGGTLDVYGTSTAPVIMTTVNDDSVAPILATSTGTPVIGSWNGIVYQGDSLGSMSDTEVRYANNALEIAATSPTITNFTATEFGFIGLYLRTFAANQIASPTVTNIVLNTSDTFNYPIYMSASATDATQTIAPVINGTSITTASTSTSAGAIHLLGIGVNPSISNMNINGGGYNVYATNNASGTFTNNTFNNATSAAVYLTNGASPVIDASNTVQNTPAAYELANQLLPPSVSPTLGVNGLNVTDPYTLRITGILPTSPYDYVMNPDPLGTGNSVYRVVGALNIASGARLVINQGSVIKAVANTLNVNSGGTLDIYGTVAQPVTFTSIKDDTVSGDTNLDGATTLPTIREGLSLNYQPGSLGSMSFFDMRYSDRFTISSAIPMNDVSRFNGGFGMSFSGSMNQTVSNLTINHVGIGGDTALYISGAGTNPVFTGTNTVDKYSATHEGVVIGSGANPTFQSFTIDLHSNGQPALAISGASTTGQFLNNVFQNSAEGIRIDSGASPIIENNIIRNNNSGIYFSQWFNPSNTKAGNVLLTNNKIVNNNIGIDITNTTSALIEHNLIRTNASQGIQVGGLNTAPGIVIRNNLIGENGQGVSVLQDATVGTDTYASIEYNTIGNNFGAGVLTDTYTNIGLRYNIIAGNAPDVLSASLALTSHYNLTGDLSLPTGAGSTDIYANPEIIGSAYLSDGSGTSGNTFTVSPAVNAGADTTLAGAGLTTTPYAQTTIIDTGALDLGYHQANPAPVISTVNTTVSVGTPFITSSVSIRIIVTPKDAAGNVIGAGLFFNNSVTGIGTVNGTAFSPIIDLGDGSYEISYANPITTGVDTLIIFVNGVALPAVNLSW